jgi:uncharacterized membrane protein YqiK
MNDFKTNWQKRQQKHAPTDPSDDLAASRERWKARAEELAQRVKELEAREPEAPAVPCDCEPKIDALKARVRELHQAAQAHDAEVKALQVKVVILRAECDGHRASRAKILGLLDDPPDDLAKAIRDLIL